MSLFGGPTPNTTPQRYGGQSTGRIAGGFQSGMMYPSPFFDVAHTYLPTTVKQLFRFSRYYYLTNPIIATTAYRLSEYPITDLWVKHEDGPTRLKWEKFLFKTLQIRTFQIEVGLDYNVYGNAIVTIAFPFVKHIICPKCRASGTARKWRPHWKLENFTFKLKCPECSYSGKALARDIYVQNPSLIRLLRHNPENIDTTYNELTGTQSYYYTLPNAVKNDLIIGRQEIIEQTPQLYLQAIAEGKAIVFNPALVFHMKRPGLADSDRAWGTPSTLPVLKDLFLLQVLKKAQEAIALEHVLPLRVLFPQGGSGTSDPYVSADLGQWKEKVATEISRWKVDRNYIPILPLPIGNQTIGGDGRAMFLTQEITQQMETILAGMGVMKEFVYGGLSWSGSNASLRILENSLLRYLERQQDLRDWVVAQCSYFLDWPLVETGSQPFKMADELQRKSLEFQLNQSGLLSSTTFLAGMDYDFEKESKISVKETDVMMEAQRAKQVANAELQGELQVIQAKYQQKVQAIMNPQGTQPMGPPGTPGAEAAPPPDPNAQQAAPQAPAPEEAIAGQSPAEQASASPLGMGQGQVAGGIDIRQLADMSARAIEALPMEARSARIEFIRKSSEPLAEMILRILEAKGVQVEIEAPPGVDMRPAPEVGPPQRLSATG